MSAPKTTAKRKETAADNDNDDEDVDSEGSDEDENTQEPVAAANASISKLLEISDDDDNVSEGNIFKIYFDDIIQILFISSSFFNFLR